MDFERLMASFKELTKGYVTPQLVLYPNGGGHVAANFATTTTSPNGGVHTLASWDTLEELEAIVPIPNGDDLHKELLRQTKGYDRTITSGPLMEQVGGDHYKGMALQPVEIISKNNLDWFQGTILKYILRHRNKNGKQDLKKAIHILELYMDQEYLGG